MLAKTLWKTLIYMGILLNANDPVALMPALKCFTGSLGAPGSTCGADLVKFHFNFYWIVMPALLARHCHARVTAALAAGGGSKRC